MASQQDGRAGQDFKLAFELVKSVDWALTCGVCATLDSVTMKDTSFHAELVIVLKIHGN